MSGSNDEDPPLDDGGKAIREALEVKDPPDIDFSDVAGLEERKKRLRESLIDPALTDRHDALGASGLLIHGASGVGKSHLVRSVVGELGYNFLTITPSDLPLESSDEAAKMLRGLSDYAREESPCVVLFDPFDAIAPASGEDEFGRPSQIGAALKSFLDAVDDADENIIVCAIAQELASVERTVRRSGRIDVVMQLSKPDKQRRRAILSNEIANLAQHVPALEIARSDIDPDLCVELTSGFKPAEIVTAIERAGQIAVADADSDTPVLDSKALRAAFEETARRKGQREGSSRQQVGETEGSNNGYRSDADKSEKEPDRTDNDNGEEGTGESAKTAGDGDHSRSDEDAEESGLGELFGADTNSGEPEAGDSDRADEDTDRDLEVGELTTPDVSYDDIGGLTRTKQRVREVVEWPRQYPDRFETLDIDPPTGVLLHGPPGTGKTLLAKAVAGETASRFISVNGPEMFDKHFGESEQHVRQLFETAREIAPSVIFFDEFDSIGAQRGGYSAGSEVTDSIVNQLLSELDGMTGLEDVVVMAATNRVDMIDPALRRPGRFDIQIEVDTPDKSGRAEIFDVHLDERPLSKDVNVDWLAEKTDSRYSGADIAAICERAAFSALRRSVDTDDLESRELDSNIGRENDAYHSPALINRRDFERALEMITPTGARDGATDADGRTFQ